MQLWVNDWTMATFDVVFVYSGGDETLNFGHRLESGSALYQVDTVGTISTEKPVRTAMHNF